MSRLVCRCAGEIVPSDRRVQIRARKSEAADELHRAHAPEQVIELCPAPALPLQPGLFPFGWRSLCGAATNDDASALACGGGDRGSSAVCCRSASGGLVAPKQTDLVPDKGQFRS